MNQIDTRAYVSVLKELVSEGQQVGMAIAGTSMEPFLKDRRDEIYFQKPWRELKPGDMVFYQRKNGQYVMHRICRRRGREYYMAGDHQTSLEGPLTEDQIFAAVFSVKRNGKILTEKSLAWKFYAGFWRYLRPVRRMTEKARRLLGRLKRGTHD